MDAKLYNLNDMVRVGCNDCQGCFSCCQGMGESIVLDPYDIWQLENNLNVTFAGLMQEKIELNVDKGLILPNLKMCGLSDTCGFLNEDLRCSIHKFRPGLCRLFPLGRKYESGELRYFLLEDACTYSVHTKAKVKKWLDITDGRRYENFLIAWHDLRKELQAEIENSSDEAIKDINLRFLHIFYERQYSADDFYGQFEERMKEFKE
ncbi:MAG: YkgJ family cysteine cluster protein [Lachnospiraceae bacterium]|nr:YkgJ family cysteine cluster protein [Lachnospiraceae bacterium]